MGSQRGRNTGLTTRLLKVGILPNRDQAGWKPKLLIFGLAGEAGLRPGQCRVGSGVRPGR
jgi:hypothetical protein